MQKLETKAEKDRKQRKRKMIVGLILVVIMILSTAGYSINRISTQQQDKELYKNFEFAKVENGWQLIGQSFGLVTRYLPREVENISYFNRLNYNNFAGREVYFVALSDAARVAANEIARNLPALRVQLACFEQDANKTECMDLPLKTCENFLIVIDEKRFNNTNVTKVTEAKIYQQENCIFVEAATKDIVRAADRMLFGIYGVIG